LKQVDLIVMAVVTAPVLGCGQP